MKKTVLAALVFSVFGTGVALANCEYRYKAGECADCYSGSYERRATKRWGCRPCSHATCMDPSGSTGEPEISSCDNQLASSDLNSIQADLRLAKNQNVALEIAKVNPHVAMIFSSLYDDRSLTLLPEKGPIVFGFGDIALDSALARELIQKHDNRERLEKPEKMSDAWIIANYGIRPTTGSAGYLTIEMVKVDKEDREIEKILPNVRVQLQRVGDEQDNGYWEPIGWETY